MNKFFKSIAAVALIMLTAACSSERDFEGDPAKDGEGIPFTVVLGGGNSSRLQYDVMEVTEKKTPYTWTLGDKVMVIADNGKYLGTLECQATSGQEGTFHTDNIVVQNGDKVHFWYFGQYQKPFADKGTPTDLAYPDISLPSNYTITENNITNGSIGLSVANQYAIEYENGIVSSTYHIYGPKSSKFAEVLSTNGIVSVKDGKATLLNGNVTMKHHTTLLSIKLSNGYGMKVTVKGGNNKATANLVDETLTNITEGEITYWNNTSGETLYQMDLVIFPGDQQSLKLSYFDESGFIAYEGKIATTDFVGGIHYCDYEGGEKEYNYGIKVKTDIDPTLSAPIVFNKFKLGGEFSYYFGRGMLYAQPSTVQRYVMMADYQYECNLPQGGVYATDTYKTNKEWNWAVLDGSQYPENVFSETTPGTHYENVTSIPKDDKFNPVYLYNQRTGYDFELPDSYWLTTLIRHWFWTPVRITDTDQSLTYNHVPMGILFCPFYSPTKENIATWMNMFNPASDTYKLIKKLYDAIVDGHANSGDIDYYGWYLGPREGTPDPWDDFTIASPIESYALNPIYNNEGTLIGQPLYILAKNSNGSLGANCQTAYMCADIADTSNHLPSILYINNSTNGTWQQVGVKKGGETYPYSPTYPVYYIRPVIKTK